MAEVYSCAAEAGEPVRTVLRDTYIHYARQWPDASANGQSSSETGRQDQLRRCDLCFPQRAI